ncbi:MAG: hypothetical protein V4508_11980 [Pseudomonadota bacterium]
MSQPLVLDNNLEQTKQLARVLYLIHGATFFFSLGMLSIVPLIINYIKRPESEGSMVYSHHSWMINSFWIYVAGVCASILVALTIIGIPLAWLMFCIAWIWKAYRLIKGFIDLNNNRAMPD